MATTPPPLSTLRSPPTPKHGAGYHSYEPYGTRHSTRLAKRCVSQDSHIPPPPPPLESDCSPFQSQPSGLDNPRRFNSDGNINLSPPRSLISSPRKKRSPSTRQATSPSVTTSLNFSLSDPFDIPHSPHNLSSNNASPTMPAPNVLPTPVKTPRKNVVQEAGHTARALFPNSAPSARMKKGRRYEGFSLESFHNDPSERKEKIEIYTDSRDCVPQVDKSAANPFRRQSKEAVRRPNGDSHNSKRRRVEPEGNSRPEEVEEALKRDDGMLYVFRGKKLFRKFSNEPDEEADSDDLGLLAARPDLVDDSVDLHVRPLTRSSIKPRTLFEDFKKSKNAVQEHNSSLTDEEAATDIEEHEDELDPRAESDTDPSHLTPIAKSNVATPTSPRGTSRETRSQASRHLHQDDTPSYPPGTHKGKRISPFNGWMRKKQNPSPTATETKMTNKRDADSVPNTITPPSKKTKGR